MNKINRNILAALLSGSSLAATGGAVADDMMPEEKSLSALEYELLGRDELWTYKALDSYSEPAFMSELVASGALPPVKDRLPAEPLVHLTGAMADGVGEYGGVFRHVIGGRPEGWNWMAGQHQGWGGINMAMQECLVRTGPLWQVKAEDQSGPLPNLAKDWTWNDDRTQLTLNLVEGARWSDGDPFDAADVEFWWNDNVQDENVSAWMSQNGMGEGTSMDVLDDSTVRFNFVDPQGPSRVLSLAYIQGCPGPSHVLKPLHPKYKDGATYDEYRNALPADMVPPVVMGPWVPVDHRPDEIVIMRRNPYYWKVDEAGNQLPYYNEMHFKLTSWSDRTTQAVAGTGDFSNMENPGNYVAALEQAQKPDSPTTIKFGVRVLAWELELNLSETVGVNDEVDAELRGLFRNKDFRVALSHALDRETIGQSVARGPFMYPFPGGFSVGSPYYDRDSTVYYGYNQDKANAMLEALGLVDTDGNGVRNMPQTGADAEIDLVYDTSEPTDKKQVDAVTAMLAEVGIKIISRSVDEIEPVADSGNFNIISRRHHWLIPTRQTCDYVPISVGCPDWHPADDDGNRNLFPWEMEMVEAVDRIQRTWDTAEAAEAARTIQRNWTENVYTIGLVQAPGALLINKRVRNAHPGTPIYMYEWAEDGIVRERLWTAAGDQLTELFEGELPAY
ncbi:MAG: ABC transporter substrate-binding protein [Rhodobacteraceae bacterium]|nr:ABC transporter substrate-binding protein [Paracoccaceae bacterium]